MSASAYLGPIWVSFCYLVLYYAFVFNTGRVKKRMVREYAERGEPFDRFFTEDREMLAADRLHMNTLEQMPPFLVLLWINAVFVDTFSATVAGCIYVLARAVYPYFLHIRITKDPKQNMMLVTMPGYLVIGWYAFAMVWATLR